MVKGEIEKPAIGIRDVYRMLDPFDIYIRYFGSFTPNTPVCNHLRGEHTPSIVIGTKNKRWCHWDFGDSYWRGDAIDLVKQIHNCSIDDAIGIIDRDFNLGLTDGKTVKRVVEYRTTEEKTVIPPPFIQVVSRKFNAEELRWWSEYHLNIDDLKQGEIYAPYKIYRNRKLLTSKYMTFCYYYPELNTWKLYRPTMSGKSKVLYERKWDTGKIPFDYCDNLENIKDCQFAYLTKSRKDRLVLKKALGVSCIADVQAEDEHCISKETINKLKGNSTVQVCIFDNDQKGLSTSHWLTKTYDFVHCNVPYKLYNKYGEQIKDFSDMAKDLGIDKVRDHFVSKKLI